MAPDTIAPPPALEDGAAPVARPLRPVDSVLSRVLRFDLSRTDVVKWIGFARNLLGLVCLCVGVMALLSAWLATRQAGSLLEHALQAQGEAIARAVARSSFVALTLEDRTTLETLLATYEGVGELAWIEVEDATKRLSLRREYGPRPERSVELAAEVRPLGGRGAASESAGRVRVTMSADGVRRRLREIAFTHLGANLVACAIVLAAGLYLIREMVDRMRDLVGEARLAEELRRANAELQAFSYSVSHDLRAPLRVIDGFGLALLEDCGGMLDEQGRDYLHRIRAGCQRMGRLIDDLLGLSRVVRRPLRPEPIDLVPLASAVVEQLRALSPGREIDVALPPSLETLADRGLMLIVLENLLGNAWKFTSKTPKARVQLDSALAGGERVFFVRDNGAGFQMEFASKLFAPFQRLHSDSEFAGTGIGLATVQRVIERHGGRIWAEAAPGRGATIYFTLGETRGNR